MDNSKDKFLKNKSGKNKGSKDTGKGSKKKTPTLEEDWNKIKDKKEINKKEINKFLIIKEKKECIEAKKDKYSFLYPTLNDPKFNIKISERKEFFDTQYDGKIKNSEGENINIEEEAEKLCNAEFELAPHQLFVRNFLSFQTPYNSLLLYHGLGTGKTCSAISVSEEMRDYLNQMGINQRIIVIASPNVQENFKLQLFDDRKLKLIDGLWNIRACTGNKFLKEINPMNMKGLSKNNVIRQVKRIISNSYVFLGYIEFANLIFKKSQISEDITNHKQRKMMMKHKLQKFFNNRLIIIDEIHNIRITDDNKHKRVALELFKLVENVDNLRLLLLSATPMYNSYKEIIWLVNLMNINDKRSTIEVKDVFESDGNFKIDEETGEEIGKKRLERKLLGYVSYVRGENPYTFPYRIWPSIFAPDKTFKENLQPTEQLNGKRIIQKMEHINIFLTDVGEYQQAGYEYILETMKHKAKTIVTKTGKEKQQPPLDNMESFGYTMLQDPLQALNIIYPDTRLDKYIEGDKENINVKELVGKNGLNNIMTYEDSIYFKGNFSYKTNKYGRIFNIENIHNYSGKIHNICKIILQSEGIILIYSQYIDGGLVPIALALEELGFTKYGNKTSLFETPPMEPIDAIDFLPKGQTKQNPFNPAKYMMITGEKSISPDNINEIKALTNTNNMNGEKIKVVLISQAGSEGLDFKNIRQVHILEPWYNMNRIEQIIGRAIRNCSHKELPFIKRNVELFLYGSLLKETNEEAADIYVYRLAEQKSLKIGKVSRVVKENAVDCILNYAQINFTEDKMDRYIKQELSYHSPHVDKMQDIPIGDKKYSSICDYMESCSYVCHPMKKLEDKNIKFDTFNETFIMMNTDKIIQRIKQLFNDPLDGKYFFYGDKLIKELNIQKEYPRIQIYSALSQLIEDKNEFITDKLGRLGNLINIGDLYLFQPIDLKQPQITLFDRDRPIEYKRTKLEFILPKEDKSQTRIKDTRQENLIIEKIKNIYDNAYNTKINFKGNDEWYEYFNIFLQKLKTNYGIIFQNIMNAWKTKTPNIPHIKKLTKDFKQKLEEAEDELGTKKKQVKKQEFELLQPEFIDAFLIDHMIETLDIQENLELINYLFSQLEIKDDFERKIKKYYEDNIVKDNGLAGILFQDNNEFKLFILKEDKWVPAEYNDQIDLSKKTMQLPHNLNNIIGMISNFKKNLHFKIKNITNPRGQGHICREKHQTRQYLNLLLQENNIFTDKSVKKLIKDPVLCILLEYIMRWFQYISKDDKTWFLTVRDQVALKTNKSIIE